MVQRSFHTFNYVVETRNTGKRLIRCVARLWKHEAAKKWV